MPDTEFSRWLNGVLGDDDVSVRELARRIARRHPVPDMVRNIESVRRALNKYRLEGRVPSMRMCAVIAEELGRDVAEIPAEPEDEIQALMRDPEFRENLRPFVAMLTQKSERPFGARARSMAS